MVGLPHPGEKPIYLEHDRALTMNVLYLYESILPDQFTKDTLFLGEVRVIAAQPNVKKIFVLGRSGQGFYDIKKNKSTKGPLEKKVKLIHFKGFENNAWYYFLGPIIFYYAFRFLKTHHIDLIQTESPHISGPPAIILGKIFKIPVISEYRASYDFIVDYRLKWVPSQVKLKIFHWLCSWVFNNCVYILANSKTYASQLKKQYKLNNISYFNAGAHPPSVKQKNKKRPITVGFLGRLYPDKGPKYFLQAISINQEKFTNANAQFILAGKGPEKPSLIAYANQKKLNDLVSFVGQQERWDFFSQIDILVNPNIIFNALEMVNYEAASQGIPVVCFGDKTYPETVKHNYSGIKVPNRNSKQLSNNVLKLILDNKLRQEYSKNAIKFYNKNYTFNKQVMLLQKTYQSINHE